MPVTRLVCTGSGRMNVVYTLGSPFTVRPVGFHTPSPGSGVVNGGRFPGEARGGGGGGGGGVGGVPGAAGVVGWAGARLAPPWGASCARPPPPGRGLGAPPRPAR